MGKKYQLLLSLFLLLSLALPAQAGVAEGVTYLQTQTQDDWVIMALAAGGANPSGGPLQTFTDTSATDYAKRILALVATGENPTSYTGSDLVAGLKNMAQNNQLGETFLLNDDAWGILALRSAGVAKSNSVIVDSKNYLLANQLPDGGWSWGVGFGSDTNDTAAVMMALIEAGYPVSGTAIQNAISYLQSTQEADGGWAYEPVWDSDAASTAWVITALTKLGQPVNTWEVNGNTPTSFLLSLQTNDGSFKWVATDSAGSASMTAFSVIALSGSSFPVKVISSSTAGGSVFVPKYSNLNLTSSVTSLETAVGGEVEYQVTITNSGPDDASNVGVAGLAGDFNNAIVTASVGTYYAENSVWRIDNLAVGESQTVTVKITLPQFENFNWVITAASDHVDQETSNNSAAITLTAVESVVVDEVVVVQEIGPIPQAQGLGEVLGVATTGCDLTVSVGEVDLSLAGYALKSQADGALWYFDPVSLKRYCLPEADTAYHALEVFGLGITNEDLEKIPVVGQELSSVDLKFVNRLKGRILLQVEDLGEAWYVNPSDGQRYYLANGQMTLDILLSLALPDSDEHITPIPIGEL